MEEWLSWREASRCCLSRQYLLSSNFSYFSLASHVRRSSARSPFTAFTAADSLTLLLLSSSFCFLS